ncbi:MAG: outer membrane beta-barrel protein, partial [Planctomycetota bacterium]|nr:outer membrane beta-barrel protein [Planctomycetota bacterium]
TSTPSALDEFPDYEPPKYDAFGRTERKFMTGFYARLSGMSVDPQEDGRLVDGSGTVDTDDGWGLSIALGYTDLTKPLSFEIEYAYRRFDTDDYFDPDTMKLADNEVTLHTITGNVLFDAPRLIGPVGLYAGIGLGVRIEEFSYHSSGDDDERGSTTEINGSGFFWQAMAGVTFAISPRTQLYGGVRYADGGELDDNDVLKIDSEMINIEFGIKFYF